MAHLYGGAIRYVAEDANGDRVASAQLTVYEAGTTTPVTTYSDTALTTPQAQPLVADSSGIFAEIYLPPGDYKVDIQDTTPASLPGFPVDNISVTVPIPPLTLTAGTAPNYTATPTPAVDQLVDGVRLYVRFHEAAPSVSDIDASGLGAKKMYQTDGTTQAGIAQIGQNFVALMEYDTTLDSGSGGWRIVVLSSTDPTSLFYNGNRTAYADSIGLTISHDDDDANVDPRLLLERLSDSPADNDDLGRIVWQGQNDAAEGTDYADISIRALDVSDGAESARMRTRMILAGTRTDVFNLQPIDSNGETVMYLLVNQGGTVSLERVKVGANDSAGSGLAALCVDNV